jgi:hypothetical protein
MKRVGFLTAVIVIAFAGVAWGAASITGKDIKDKSLTGKDIKDKSLTKKDFRGSVRGPRGFAGASGPAGPAGALGLQVVEAAVVVQPGDVDGPQAFCPSGKAPVGSGFYAGIAHAGFVQDFGSSVGAGYVNDTSIPVETKVQAICAGGGAVAARVSSASSRREFAQAIADLKRSQ